MWCHSICIKFIQYKVLSYLSSKKINFLQKKAENLVILKQKSSQNMSKIAKKPKLLGFSSQGLNHSESMSNNILELATNIVEFYFLAERYFG